MGSPRAPACWAVEKDVPSSAKARRAGMSLRFMMLSMAWRVLTLALDGRFWGGPKGRGEHQSGWKKNQGPVILSEAASSLAFFACEAAESRRTPTPSTGLDN